MNEILADTHTAARIIADLLCTTLMRSRDRGDQVLATIDKEGLQFLSKYMKENKDWSLNWWTVSAVRCYEHNENPLIANLQGYG